MGTSKDDIKLHIPQIDDHHGTMEIEVKKIEEKKNFPSVVAMY